jgi:hypothetical protein
MAHYLGKAPGREVRFAASNLTGAEGKPLPFDHSVNLGLAAQYRGLLFLGPPPARASSASSPAEAGLNSDLKSLV